MEGDGGGQGARVAAEPFLIEVLGDVIRSLNRKGADYALAGGLAYGAWVEPRATTDIDVLMLLDNPSPERLADLFAQVFDSLVPHPAPMAFKRLSVWRIVGIRRQREILIDLLLAESVFLKGALARKQTVDFLGVRLPIVSLEDLILLKALGGRLQDLADLERITQQPSLQIDWEYVKQWVARLDLPPIQGSGSS